MNGLVRAVCIKALEERRLNANMSEFVLSHSFLFQKPCITTRLQAFTEALVLLFFAVMLVLVFLSDISPPLSVITTSTATVHRK